ncbi:hypothetical protein OAO55_02550 [Bacteroidales bacterium]|nr:hypothetical protein [Bacteroidales bacterium]
MKEIIVLLICFSVFSCKSERNLEYDDPDVKIIFLHHSTGNNVYGGKKEILSKISKSFEEFTVPKLLAAYNEVNSTKYAITEQAFPKGNPYPWNNYPYDYYNIWVKNGDKDYYMEEPTLSTLTKEYDLIIFKHCFPSSAIKENDSISNIDSDKKTLGNYKLQYTALKEKMLTYPKTKFIVWTPAALVESHTKEEDAMRANEFVNWMKNDWDQDGDNIFVFDFRTLETEGGLYLKPENANSSHDSHPNPIFCEKAADKFVDTIISVIKK